MTDTPPRRDLLSADAGTDEQFAHWDSAQQQQEARRAIDVPGGRAAHLSCRWTQPRGGGLASYGSANRMGVADLLEIPYAVVLNETPDLAPDREWLTAVAQLCALGAIDTAL